MTVHYFFLKSKQLPHVHLKFRRIILLKKLHTYMYLRCIAKYKRSVRKVICVKTFSDTASISDICKRLGIDFFKISRLLYRNFPIYIAMLTIIKAVSFCSSPLCSCIVFHELGNGYENNKELYGMQESKSVFSKSFPRPTSSVINTLRLYQLERVRWSN